ncbi:hypothetical protein SMICM304S_04542 [Streptomyces microflavus]
METNALAGERAEEDPRVLGAGLAGADVLTGLPSQVALPPDAPIGGDRAHRRLPNGEESSCLSPGGWNKRTQASRLRGHRIEPPR